MPAFNLDQIDDAPVFDASSSFDGGMVSNSRANLLKENQLAELINCDITISGQLVTRRGTSDPLGDSTRASGTYIQGLFYFDAASYQYLMAAYGRILYSLIGDTWTALTGFQANNSLADILMVQGVSKVYLIDGTQNIFSWDGVKFVNLGSATNSQPPASPKAIAWFTSRLMAAGMLAEPDAIYFSGILAASTWDKTNWQVRVGGGDNDRIMGLIPWTNFNLLVPKTGSHWIVNCNPTFSPAEFSITRVHSSIGTLAPKTYVQAGTDIMGLTTSGVRSIQRTIASEQQNQVGEALSYPIQDIIDRINPNAIGTSVATFWNSKYILAIPLDAATSPNAIVVYNKQTESWSGVWTGVNATSFAVRGVPGDLPRLAIGLDNGRVVDWLDYVKMADETPETFQDTGADIPTSITTRAFTFNEPASPKTGFNVELEFNESASTVNTEAILDNKPPIELQESPFTSGSPGLTLPLTLPFALPTIGVVRKACDLQFTPAQFRELQLKLTTTSGKLSLRNIAASAFIDTVQIQS